MLSQLDDGSLIETDTFVQADEFLKVVPVPVVNDYLARIHICYLARFFRSNRDVRILRNGFLHPGSNKWRLRGQQRKSLPLHVGPHQRAVSVVVLQKRDEARRNTHKLLR